MRLDPVLPLVWPAWMVGLFFLAVGLGTAILWRVMGRASWRRGFRLRRLVALSLLAVGVALLVYSVLVGVLIARDVLPSANHSADLIIAPLAVGVMLFRIAVPLAWAAALLVLSQFVRSGGASTGHPDALTPSREGGAEP